MADEKPKKPFKRRSRKRRSAVSLKIAHQNKINKRKYSRKYLELITYVKTRDSWSCQMPRCKNPKGVKTSCHHIQRFFDKKALRENKFNLITLCHTCHREVTGKESRYESRFKIIARRNEANYKKNKKTKDEIIAELKANQQLPDDFKEYEYKTHDEIMQKKTEEWHLRKTWRLIKFRTQNKTSNSYKNYGARGIKMWEEWIDNYEKFEEYVNENLGDRPEESSIDRIDNDKGYEPGNIRWATAEIQGQNRRTGVLNEELVAVILILYYRYKFKIYEILEKLSLPNRSLINGVVHIKSWKNISLKYKKIIDCPKALKALEEYEEKGGGKNNGN